MKSSCNALIFLLMTIPGVCGRNIKIFFYLFSLSNKKTYPHLSFYLFVIERQCGLRKKTHGLRYYVVKKELFLWRALKNMIVGKSGEDRKRKTARSTFKDTCPWNLARVFQTTTRRNREKWHYFIWSIRYKTLGKQYSLLTRKMICYANPFIPA